MNIRKQKKLRKNLINKKSLRYFIENSRICQHAINEFKLAGYNIKRNGPDRWIYEQVLEALAVFSSHGNSGFSAPLEINLVSELSKFGIISPLTFEDDEWTKSSLDNSWQNKRYSKIFKDPNGDIYNIEAFVKNPIKTYRYNTKKWEDNNKNILWNGSGLFECHNGVFTGKYLSKCLINEKTNYTPKDKIVIKCLEIEFEPDNWVMCVDSDSEDIKRLEMEYNCQWKSCPCLKDIKIENMTSELEKKAIEETHGE